MSKEISDQLRGTIDPLFKGTAGNPQTDGGISLQTSFISM